MKKKKKPDKIEKEEYCEWFTEKTKKFSEHLWLPNGQDIVHSHKYKFNDNQQTIKFESFKSNVYQEKFKPKYKPQKNILKLRENNYNKSIKKAKEDKTLDDDEKKKKLYAIEKSYKKFLKSYGKTMKSKNIQIHLTSEQKKIIMKWIDESDKVYNYCVDMYNDKHESFTMDYKKLKLLVFKELFKGNKSCPYDILTDEVRIFCSNLKSCLTNKENNNIKKFEMKYRRNFNSRSLLIPKTAITKKGIYPTVLGKFTNNKLTEILKNPISDSRLIYNKKTGTVYLNIPIMVTKKNIIHPKDIVSIDPGESIPFVTYSEDNYCKIGENMRKKILYEQSKIKKNQKLLNGIFYIKNKKHLRVKINKSYKKIRNIVREMINKTAIFLCSNYKRILLPEFPVQNIVKQFSVSKVKEFENPRERAKMNKLYKRIKFVLLNLSHYKFRQHLSHKCDEYGCQLEIVNEYNTSKCCTKCGFLSDNYIHRHKHCPKCKYDINRDVNGARNILLKNHNLFIKAIR